MRAEAIVWNAVPSVSAAFAPAAMFMLPIVRLMALPNLSRFRAPLYRPVGLAPDIVPFIPPDIAAVFPPNIAPVITAMRLRMMLPVLPVVVCMLLSVLTLVVTLVVLLLMVVAPVLV
jgi:hypothetical protein